MIDIDHFKRINDTHGHVEGDRVLVAVASVMKTLVRGSDLATRWGGEELLALLPVTSIEGVRVFAERLRAAVEERVVAATGIQVTISIGVAERLHGEAILHAARADRALYVAKSAGRNCVR